MANLVQTAITIRRPVRVALGCATLSSDTQRSQLTHKISVDAQSTGCDVSDLMRKLKEICNMTALQFLSHLDETCPRLIEQTHCLMPKRTIETSETVVPGDRITITVSNATASKLNASRKSMSKVFPNMVFSWAVIVNGILANSKD